MLTVFLAFVRTPTQSKRPTRAVQAPPIILDSRSTVFMDKNDKYTKHTRNISRRVNFVRNGENAKCTGLDGVKEVCNWQALKLRMLMRMTQIQELNISW